MHSCNNTEHYINHLCYLTTTKHKCTSSQCIFNWNTSAIVYKQGAVGFPIANNSEGQPYTPQSLTAYFHICTRGRYVIKFMPRPLYIWLKSLRKLAHSIRDCLAHRCHRRFGEQRNYFTNFSRFVRGLNKFSFSVCGKSVS
jgi:hypothetical protein